MACSNASPGPAYGLHTLTGFEGHDYSKYRNPAYSFGLKGHSAFGPATPGPYKVENCDRSGQYNKNGWTLAGRPKDSLRGSGPGPGDYLPNAWPRYPAYSFGLKCDAMRRGTGPSAAEYFPQFHRGPGWTIAGRPRDPRGGATPGPGASSPLDMYKLRAPAYSLGLKPNARESLTPGPGPAYNPKTPTCGQRGFSFGLKGKGCAAPLVTYEDNNC